MERKIASLVIQIQAGTDTNRLNHILTEFGTHILGRLGLNLQHRKMAIISIIVEADTDIIGALSGKIGRLPGIKVKTAMLKTNQN